MNAARDPSRLADAVADLKDPEMIKSAREMMAQAEPAFQVEMQRMMEQPEMRKVVLQYPLDREPRAGNLPRPQPIYLTRKPYYNPMFLST